VESPPGAFRLLLRLLPRDFRERNRAEMEALFQEQLRGRSRIGRLTAWTAAAWDVVKTAARLRVRALRTAPDGGGRTATRALGTLDGLRQDLRYAVRSLRRQPGFSAVAVVVLAVGIGANTTIFSVVDGVLLRPLPYEASERIGILWHEFGDGAQNLPVLNPLDLRDYREWSRVVEAYTMGAGDERILGTGAEARIVQVGFVEAGFFEFFGVVPLHGRTIRAEEDVPDAPPVAVLSHRLWTTAYGADPGIVGRTVSLDGEDHRVVGVLPPGFRLELPARAIFLKDAEIWTAARIDLADQPARNYTLFTAFGRLRPGATFAEAQEELERMEARLRERHPVHAAANLQARIVPLQDDVVKETRPALLLLFGAVGLVLVVACANVANLVLARGRSRRTELSIRAALGAGRRRVVRHVLLESAVLAGVGGAAGVAVGAAGLEAVRVLGRASLPRLDGVVLDGRVLAFAVVASGLAALIAGLVPALRAASASPAETLTGGRGGAGSRSGTRFRNGLVLAEVAVSVILLIGAGLMVRSFVSLQDVDPGFEAEGALTFRLSLPDDAYPDDESERAFYRRLEERLAGLPGVESVSAVSQLPLTGRGVLQPYAYDEETAVNWESVTADRRWIAPGFFRTVGATLLEGREFTSADLDDDRWMVVIDDRLARRAFPGRSAVGERIQMRPSSVPEERRYAEVIGVVSHLRLHDLARPELTQIYSPMRGGDQFSVVVRSAGPAHELGPTVRRVVEALGPGVPVEDMATMDALVARARAPARASLVLMAVFGGVALVLAAIGLYGVLAFAVRQRTREIGIRMALGEAPARVVGSIIGRGMGLVLVATAVGVCLAAVLARFVASQLYGVDPTDPVVYLGVSAVLGLAALPACWVPARRATRIDPVEALRTE